MMHVIIIGILLIVLISFLLINNQSPILDINKIIVYNHLLIPIKVEDGTIIPAESHKAINDNNSKYYINNKLFQYYKNFNNKEIHIGLVDTDNLIYSSSYKTVMRELKQIRIHNQTNIPLMFNEHILVPPMSYVDYEGREQTGINMGFVLENTDGIFKSFKVSYPLTDVYFGKLSEHLFELNPEIDYLQ